MSQTLATSPQGSRQLLSPSWVERLAGEEAPSITFAALGSGPWEVRRLANGTWGCLATGETQPRVVVRERSLALLFAAALPAASGLPRLRLRRYGRQWLLFDHWLPVGSLAHGEDELVSTVDFLAGVAASPPSLAHFYEAAGAPVLARAGAILQHRRARR